MGDASSNKCRCFTIVLFLRNGNTPPALIHQSIRDIRIAQIVLLSSRYTNCLFAASYSADNMMIIANTTGCGTYDITVHYGDVIMGSIASQITSLTIVYSTVYADAAKRKHQSSASLAFVWGIHRGPVNSSHRWRVARKMFPFSDVIMYYSAWLDHF